MLLISFLFTALTMPMGWSTPTGPVCKNRARPVAIENLTWEQLPKEALQMALSGYRQLLNSHLLKPNALLTLIDLSKPSSEERLFVIDLAQQRIVLQSLVAHGIGSGFRYAQRVSNEVASNQSSAGFFITKETYEGKNGYSLRLEGLQKGINDHALARGIVVHGARYVDPDAARKTGWVGRSQGCPAVPVRIHQQLIDLIKGNNCVFIFHPSYAQHTAQYAPMFITKAYRGE